MLFSTVSWIEVSASHKLTKKNMKILTGPFFLAPLASWCLLSLSSTRIRKPFISYCYECNLRLALRSLKRFAYKRIQAANCCLNSFQQFQPFSCVFRETATSASVRNIIVKLIPLYQPSLQFKSETARRCSIGNTCHNRSYGHKHPHFRRSESQAS